MQIFVIPNLSSKRSHSNISTLTTTKKQQAEMVRKPELCITQYNHNQTVPVLHESKYKTQFNTIPTS